MHIWKWIYISCNQYQNHVLLTLFRFSAPSPKMNSIQIFIKPFLDSTLRNCKIPWKMLFQKGLYVWFLYLSGWSVTVAGSYNQDMAPDLEMRLSFPKPGGSGGLQHQQQSITSNQTVHQNVSDRREIHHHQRVTNGNNIYSESHYQDEDLLNDNFTRSNNHHQFQALPPAGNPKRTLTRIVSGLSKVHPPFHCSMSFTNYDLFFICACILLGPQFRFEWILSHNPTERTHSQRDINFPEVSPSSRNPIASRQMAKKAIKVLNRINYLLYWN